jgi:hypothetical protein
MPVMFALGNQRNLTHDSIQAMNIYAFAPKQRARYFCSVAASPDVDMISDGFPTDAGHLSLR